MNPIEEYSLVIGGLQHSNPFPHIQQWKISAVLIEPCNLTLTSNGRRNYDSLVTFVCGYLPLLFSSFSALSSFLFFFFFAISVHILRLHICPYKKSYRISLSSLVHDEIDQALETFFWKERKKKTTFQKCFVFYFFIFIDSSTHFCTFLKICIF